MPSFKTRLRAHLKEILKTKKSPHSIASGASLGTLIGTLPIPFIDFFIALLVILIFKKISKYALFTSVLFWNPVTKIPIYALSYFIGDVLFKDLPLVPVELSLWDTIYFSSRRFLVGNIIISILLTSLTYLFAYSIVKIIQKRRKKESK